MLKLNTSGKFRKDLKICAAHILIYSIDSLDRIYDRQPGERDEVQPAHGALTL
jgi:hypothetical protein